MQNKRSSDTHRWLTVLERVQREYLQLPDEEQAWLSNHLRLIVDCQIAIDNLFQNIEGGQTCKECRGACCGSGKHHFTLANLLVCLADGELPPPPDLTLSCPFLGQSGCRLTAAKRPYNCITFFCEMLDSRLSEADRSAFEELDRTLRHTYETLSRTYPAASLRGLWMAVERIGQRPIFTKNVADMVK